MIKLFVSDVDGTLLDSTSSLREATRQAVLELRRSGVQFAIATGRSYNSIFPLMETLGGEIPVICLNGAQIYDVSGNCIRQHFLPAEHIPTLLDVISALRCYALCFCTSGNYLPYGLENSRRILTDSLVAMHQFPYTRAEALCNKILTGSEAVGIPEKLDLAREGLMKIQYVFSSESQRQQAVEMLSGLKEVQMAVTPYDLEVTAEAAAKGTSVQALCGHLEIRPEETAVIGDSANDRQMLSLFTHSFAMGNADEETRHTAKKVVAANDEDGVAEAIRCVLGCNNGSKKK